MELKYLGFGYYHDKDTEKWQLNAHPESVEKFRIKLEINPGKLASIPGCS